MRVHPIYRITTFVPPESLDALLEGIEAQAPLRFGPYDRSAWWSVPGVEQFRPLPGSTPTVGKAGSTERVPTVRLEFAIPRDPDLLDRVLTRGWSRTTLGRSRRCLSTNPSHQQATSGDRDPTPRASKPVRTPARDDLGLQPGSPSFAVAVATHMPPKSSDTRRLPQPSASSSLMYWARSRCSAAPKPIPRSPAKLLTATSSMVWGGGTAALDLSSGRSTSCGGEGQSQGYPHHEEPSSWARRDPAVHPRSIGPAVSAGRGSHPAVVRQIRHNLPTDPARLGVGPPKVPPTLWSW